MPFLRMTPAPGDEHSGLPSSSYQFATHTSVTCEVRPHLRGSGATNYEAGVRRSWRDGRFSTNGTLFHVNTLLHWAVMTATLCGPGGVRAVIAENLLLKQQLIVLRQRR